MNKIKKYKILSILLIFVSITIGQQKNKSLILEMDNEKVIIPFGNNIELFYEDSIIVSVVGELQSLTNGKIILRQKATNNNFEIPVNNVKKINASSRPSFNGFVGGCLKGCLIGSASVLTPLVLFSNGNLKASQSVLIAMFLTPPATIIGGLFYGIKSTKKQASKIESYDINDKDWRIINREIILI